MSIRPPRSRHEKVCRQDGRGHREIGAVIADLRSEYPEERRTEDDAKIGEHEAAGGREPGFSTDFTSLMISAR